MRIAEDASDIRSLADAELDDVDGGFLPWIGGVLGGILTGFIAGSIAADYDRCGRWTCEL